MFANKKTANQCNANNLITLDNKKHEHTCVSLFAFVQVNKRPAILVSKPRKVNNFDESTSSSFLEGDFGLNH